MNPERTEAGAQRASDKAESSRSGGTVRLVRPDGAATVEKPGRMIICPVCRLKNPDTEMFCGECGFLLTSKLEDFAGLPSSTDLAGFPHLEDTSGRTYPLRPGVNTLGRESTDILIVDKSVSRYHGMIVFDEERNLFSVEDTGSTNGSQLNGEALNKHTPRAIRPGDNLTFGNIGLRFVSGSRAAARSVAPDSAGPDMSHESITRELTAGPKGRLALLRGNGPREVVVDQGVTTMGRAPDNKICLSDDKYVSGHHAKVEVDGDLFLLLDVGSTNGTFLNGLRMTTNTAIALGDTDEVLIGGLLFQFHKITERAPLGSDADRTLLGAPTLDHLSAARIGDNGAEA